MANPSRDKGNRFEWDTIAWAETFLHDLGSPLTVERTRAGYQRDWGDILVKCSDDRILGTLQLKNRRQWNISEWTDQTVRQQAVVRARFGALFVKRPRVADPGRTFAIMPANEYLRLLVQLDTAECERDELRTIIANHDGPGYATELANLETRARVAERRARVAEESLAVLREQAGVSVLTSNGLTGPDPDALQDDPGTVRGAQVYPQPYVPSGRPFGPRSGLGDPRREQLNAESRRAHGLDHELWK